MDAFLIDLDGNQLSQSFSIERGNFSTVEQVALGFNAPCAIFIPQLNAFWNPIGISDDAYYYCYHDLSLVAEPSFSIRPVYH